jgi:hypothetical protein
LLLCSSTRIYLPPCVTNSTRQACGFLCRTIRLHFRCQSLREMKWRRISGRQAQGWSSTMSSTSRPATPHPVALPATASTPSRNSNRGLGLRYRIPSGELQYTPLISTTCYGGDGGSTPSPTSALVENYLICTVDCFSFTKYICSHASCFRYCSAHDVALCSHSEQVG